MPSRQRKFGGGKFRSESQRKMMWARFPRAAKDWAHNRKTSKSDWVAVAARSGTARPAEDGAWPGQAVGGRG
jgi:hypothetical protein